jgi:hypothetical protein
MDAITALGDPDLATRLLAILVPGAWHEAYPREVFDAGSVGGDIQAGDAHSRRFVRWLPDRKLWAVINDSYYLAKCDHDADDHETYDGELRCKHCGPLVWVQNQTELIICRDFTDPGGTEVAADSIYRDDVCDLDSQATDAFAHWQAQRCEPKFYGDPWL